MNYFKYIKMSKITQTKLFIAIMLPIISLLYEPYFDIMPFVIFIVILTAVFTIDYRNIKKVKEPTWKLIDWINTNAENNTTGAAGIPLYEWWWMTGKIKKGSNILYNKEMECFNEHEHDVINELATSKLVSLRDEFKKAKDDEKHKLRREEITKLLEEEL